MHLVTDHELDLRRIAGALPGATLKLTFVAPSDTLAAGCCVAELALAEDGPERLIAHDVPAGAGDPGPWPPGLDECFCIARSLTGSLVVGRNVGWAWSFVIDGLRGMCRLDVSPRRSADRLPVAVAHAGRRHPHVLAGVVSRSAVPPPPERAVAHVDDRGTVRTTLATLPAPSGERVLVGIGDVTAPAVVSDGNVPVADGELALAPGPAGGYLELQQRGGSAAERFSGPAAGTPIRVSAAR